MDTRVLVVDDEQDTLNLLRTILEISGYVPILTLNSVDAVSLAEVEKPDIVLLDIMMPKLDGFTLCKMMRANATTRSLPIIFVTAYEALDIEERRVEAGANKVINKPINMEILVAAIDEVLNTPASPAEKPSAAESPTLADPPAASDEHTAKTQESASDKSDLKVNPKKDAEKGKDKK
jgi:DNA-binding response OmpR family regulator